MKPISIIQDERGNGGLLACCRIDDVIHRKALTARMGDRENAVAEAQALYPGNREVNLYLGVKS